MTRSITTYALKLNVCCTLGSFKSPVGTRDASSIHGAASFKRGRETVDLLRVAPVVEAVGPPLHVAVREGADVGRQEGGVGVGGGGQREEEEEDEEEPSLHPCCHC